MLEKPYIQARDVEMGIVLAPRLYQKPRCRYQLLAVFAKNNTIKDNPICATEADKRASPSKNGTMILLRKIRKREASGATLIYDLQNLEQIWGKKTFVWFVNKSIHNTSFSTSFMIQRQYFNVSMFLFIVGILSICIKLYFVWFSPVCTGTEGPQTGGLLLHNNVY